MAIGSEVALLVALVVLGALLVWERLSGTWERDGLRTRAERQEAWYAEREADLLDRLTKALGKTPPPRREVAPVERTMPVAPFQDAPPPPVQDNGVYPSIGLTDDQQEMAQRMAQAGRSPDEIWRALMQAQT